MKSLLFSVCFLLSFWSFAQNDVEETSLSENIPFMDATSSTTGFSIRGVYQLKNASCNEANFKSLVYPGGTDKFVKELKKKLELSTNWNTYVINGLFYIKLEITKNGVISKIDAGPKVANSEMFLKDLKDAISKLKTTWIPAKCNGNAIDSQAIIKIDFSSMTYDNAFN